MAVLDAHYGKIEYCLKQSELLPAKMIEQECLQKGFLDGDNHGAQSNLVNLFVGKDTGASDGKYYLLLKGSSHSGISVGFIEKPVDQASDTTTFVMRNLKAGVAINDRISYVSTTKFYTFQLTLPENVEAIGVTLTPKRGRFRIAITNNGQKPAFEKTQGLQVW